MTTKGTDLLIIVTRLGDPLRLAASVVLVWVKSEIGVAETEGLSETLR